MKHYGAIRFPSARWHRQYHEYSAICCIEPVLEYWYIPVLEAPVYVISSVRRNDLIRTHCSTWNIIDSRFNLKALSPADITGYHRLAVESKHTSRNPVSLNSLTLWKDCFETSWLRHDRILSATVALSGLTSYKSSLTVIKHRVRMYASLILSAKPVVTVSRETSIISIQFHGYHSKLQYQKQAFFDCVISALYSSFY